jgi:hypothetical protein
LPEPASPASTPTLSPAQLAEAAARSRRDSGVQIDDQDVVGEEEIHAPLSGSYRLSSLRLIDESFQAERWGEDAEAAARLETLRTEIRAAARFFDLVR